MRGRTCGAAARVETRAAEVRGVGAAGVRPPRGGARLRLATARAAVDAGGGCGTDAERVRSATMPGAWSVAAPARGGGGRRWRTRIRRRSAGCSALERAGRERGRGTRRGDVDPDRGRACVCRRCRGHDTLPGCVCGSRLGRTDGPLSWPRQAAFQDRERRRARTRARRASEDAGRARWIIDASADAHRQAGHAALELLELADVHRDDLVPEAAEQLRGARR
jgi:hypothetical protein